MWAAVCGVDDHEFFKGGSNGSFLFFVLHNLVLHISAYNSYTSTNHCLSKTVQIKR